MADVIKCLQAEENAQVRFLFSVDLMWGHLDCLQEMFACRSYPVGHDAVTCVTSTKIMSVMFSKQIKMIIKYRTQFDDHFEYDVLSEK